MEWFLGVDFPVSIYVMERREDANSRKLQINAFLKLSHTNDPQNPLLSSTHSNPSVLLHQEIQRTEAACSWSLELTIHFLPGLHAKHSHFKGLKTVLYLHKWLFPSVNQNVAAQMVVPDKGFATAFMVTNKWSLAGRREENTSILP